jgi:hypothetical protein
MGVMLRRAVILLAGVAMAKANSGNGESMTIAKRAQIYGNDEETRNENEGARYILVAPALETS